MPRKDKVIHINNLPSTFRGNITRNGRFIQNGISPLGGAYDKVAKSTGLIRLSNEFLYNGVNNLVSKDNREKLMNNTAGRLINYVKDFNKESLPSDDELGPTFPFNIIQTPRSNGRNLPQKQYAVGGKIPNVVAGGIAQPLGNNFFYMNGRKHSQGGIDIGPSDKTGIEVEDGEVVETNGNELKVYSAQPILNGASPAKLVMGGANPNKVFKAQEDFKDRNGINDDGTYVAKSDNTRVTPIIGFSRNSGIKQEDFIYYPETYRIANNTLEKVPARREVNMTPLEQVNPEFDILLNGAGILRDADKATKVAMALDKNISRTSQKAITKGRDALGYYSLSPNIRYNLSVNDGRKALDVKPTKLPKAPKTQLTSNIGKYKDFVDVLDSVGKAIDIIDVNSDKFKGIPYTRDHFDKYTKDYSRKSRKLGGKNMIVSISGNVKNGLIHSPSSTGGLRDKFTVGGTRINRHGRTWEYDEQIGAYVPITNSTTNKPNIDNSNRRPRHHAERRFPLFENSAGITNSTIDKSARGETIIGSVYTFRNGRWTKNNNVNTNTNKPNIDNGNRRPQYYAERRLPLFENSAGITSGLVRAGWSHGNNKGVSMNNTNIPSLSATKFSRKTPRGGRSKSSQSTQSVPTKTPPIAVYNRNLPKVEANIPTTLPVSTSTPAKGTTSSDGKGQGKFKNITAADWIGLGSNMAGSLASYFASRRTINKMRGPGQPTLISANKLKTKYNINPQLDRIREDKFEAYRDIDSNTASSRVSLARKQQVRNATGQAVNELYGNKENIETNLINQDRHNQQSVRQFNAQQYNQYIDRKTAFDNGIREAKVTNINNLFSGINAGIQDMISRYENRKALNNTIGAMRASAPNVDDRIMRDAGVDYDEFIIRKRRKLGGKQSCR
nr:MAG: hypothetical protein [Bacteriophage sp.]